MAPEVVAMYSQHDFVPAEMFASWAAHGNRVGSILERLMLPTDVGNAVLADIGVHAGDHVSVVSYITPNEWEAMLAPPMLQGVPINIGMRSRIRQVLLAARLVTGVVRPPVEREPAAPVIIHQPSARDDTSDILTTVNIMDVYLQGAEPCRVKIMSNADYQAGLDRYFKIEGRSCPEDRRPTAEQRSAFLELLRKKDSLYGDYAILVLHGDRALMRRHFTARVMNSKWRLAGDGGLWASHLS